MPRKQNTSNEYGRAFIKFFLIGMLLGSLGCIQEIIFNWEFLLEWILYAAIVACGLMVGLIGMFILFWGKRQRRKSLTTKSFLQFKSKGFQVENENIYGIYKGHCIIIAYVAQAPKQPQPAIAIRIPHQFKVIDSNIETSLNVHSFFRNKIEIRSNCLTYYEVYNFKKPSYDKLIERIDILLKEIEKSGRIASEMENIDLVQWLYISNTKVKDFSAS